LKKYLKDVTLIAYSSHEVQETIVSLQKCQEGLDFFEVKLLTHEQPINLPKNIIYEYAPEINHINDFNLYMFKFLGTHVNTAHALYVQAHSWILHPELWDDNWLQYDYIGSPWPYKEDAYVAWGSGKHIRNGNGGFSLRSSRIMSIPYDHDLPLLREQGWTNEDGNICSYYSELMLALDVKYAPVEIAAKFAYENPVPENNYGSMKTFGFHRNHRIGE
jgi:hypothetical protein